MKQKSEFARWPRHRVGVGAGGEAWPKITGDYWSPILPVWARNLEFWELSENQRADGIRLAKQESDFKLRSNGYKELVGRVLGEGHSVLEQPKGVTLGE